MQIINVLVVAQCTDMLDMLCSSISMDPSLRLIGRCFSSEEALNLKVQTLPDVIALDMQLTQDASQMMNCLKKTWSAAVVALSAATGIALQTLDEGADDFIYMPVGESDSDQSSFITDAIEKIKTATIGRRADDGTVNDLVEPSAKLVIIGSGKGGPVSLATILTHLPKDGPPVIIVQRSISSFCSNFNQLLSDMTGRNIIAGTDYMELADGSVTVINNNSFFQVEEADEKLILNRKHDNEGQIDSLDALLISAAEVFGNRVVGVLLSGSGEGEEGLKCLAACGTLALRQNKNALLYDIGYTAPGGVFELPLEDMAGEITKRIK